MIVLSIFIIIATITAFQIKPQAHAVDKHFFLSQLSSDLYYAQLYAIANQTDVTVNFSPAEHEYYFYEKPGKGFLLERKYADNIEIYGGSLNLNFRFLPDGNINKFGSFFIRIDGVRYKITFLIGKGRFYIE